MIERKDIDRLAELALLKITDGEAEALTRDIDSIVEYISELSEAPAEDATLETEIPAGALRNIMREDGAPHESNLYTEAILQAAPERKGQYITVKKIL